MFGECMQRQWKHVCQTCDATTGDLSFLLFLMALCRYAGQNRFHKIDSTNINKLASPCKKTWVNWEIPRISKWMTLCLPNPVFFKAADFLSSKRNERTKTNSQFLVTSRWSIFTAGSKLPWENENGRMQLNLAPFRRRRCLQVRHMVWLQVMKAVSFVVIAGLHAIAFRGGAMPNVDQKIH